MKGKYEVRWRKKGTKTWHHDRVTGEYNYYMQTGRKVSQKKYRHRTLSYDDAIKRMNQLKRKLGDGYEFMLKHWGAGYRH